MSELQAVNQMLLTIGQSPVNSLSSGLKAVSTARIILSDKNRETQLIGMRCNKEKRKLYPESVNGYIYVPENTLNYEAYWPKDNISLRGNRLFNNEEVTYVFSEYTEGYLTILLPFAYLPEHVRNYVTIRAARVFQKNVIGSDTLDGFTQEDETRAWLILHRREIMNKTKTMLSSTPVFGVAQSRRFN